MIRKRLNNNGSEELGRLRLRSETNEDLLVVSTLCQDAVVRNSDIVWLPKRRRFSLLLNRYKWECSTSKISKIQDYYRINSVLSFENVLRVQSKLINQKEGNQIQALLNLQYQNDSSENHVIQLIFSGGGTISLEVECIDSMLSDISEAFQSVSRLMPSHDETNFE